MAIIVDSSCLVAFVDADDPLHDKVHALITTTREALVLSPFVIAETDHLVQRELGRAAALAILSDIAGGGFVIEPLDAPAIATCVRLTAQHFDLGIGITDASLLFLAERHGTNKVATVDQRHFRMLRTMRGDPFVLLPMDAPAKRKR